MLNWLHLTDLHWGLSGQQTLFPNVKDRFFVDLESLLQKTGPWDLILFTGDLVQAGKREEFDSLDDNFLKEFKEFLNKQLGYEPVMLAVPGNHDLDRKVLGLFPATTRSLLDPSEFFKTSDLLFSEPKDSIESESRLAMQAAFKNYAHWWDRHVESVWGPEEGSHAKCIETRRLEVSRPVSGLMPGDFSATVAVQPADGDARRIGVVGLNTTFLQLAAGDFRGKLSWDPRQLNAVCEGDAPAWIKEHDACLLMTHQGPDWLSPSARREAMYEINPPGRFAVHLFGHEHELDVRLLASLGGPLQNTWQGSSLFGLETFGEESAKMERRHGFSAGRLDVDQAELRIWPRKAVATEGIGLRFLADRERCILGEDDSLSQPISQVSNSNWKVMDLDRAQADVMRELMKFLPQDEIVIHHLGLDMTEAKNRLIVMLREEIRAKKIRIKLLVLSEDANNFPDDTPQEVRDWSQHVNQATKYIIDEITKLEENFGKQDRKLELTIRSYKTVPTIHGFSLKKRHSKDEEQIATYFAFCRYSLVPQDQPEAYDWGGSRYWKISQDRRDRLSEDMQAVFEGSFQHLWRSGSSVGELVIPRDKQ